jgi:hypothetical protein
MNLSDEEEKDPPRILKYCWKGALVTRESPSSDRSQLGKEKNLDEGVREPPYIPRNPTHRIYPMGDRIYPIWLDMSGLDPDISGGLGLSEILQKIGPDRIYLSWDRYI